MSEAKQKLILLAVPLSLSFTWNAFPANSKPRVSSCVSEPCKLNPCPSVCYLHVLTKEQGKGKWALPKNLPRLLITSWQRKDVWKTLFQNKSSGTINPVYLPHKTPEQHKECVNQQNTVYFKSCPILYPATLEEHPINNNDLDRVRLLNTCCITQKVRC